VSGVAGWLLSLAAGAIVAALTYAGRAAGRHAPFAVTAAALRALAAALLVALILDAPVGPARVAPPLVALDVSASWARAGGTSAYEAARDSARRLAPTALLVGDSLREGDGPERPADAASHVRPAVERALAAGRTLVLLTDGELDDADALARLPAGSRVRVLPRASRPDAAVAAVEAPRAAVGGDSAEVRVRLAAGAGGAPAGVLRLSVEDGAADSVQVDSLPAFGERTLAIRLPLPRREGSVLVRAVVAAAGDAEPANDSATVVLELSEAAGVTVASTAPDFDLRYMLEVLRGTVALPTRAFLQVAPGQWRAEGSLAPVGVEAVRAAVRRSPVVVLHGDTAAFGPPAGVGQGALLLVPGVATGEAEWYAVAAPPSPLAAALSGVPWDSLPPLAVGTTAAPGEWTALTVQRGRQFERQAVVAGREEPRRRAVVAASGMWRWRFRGGVAGDAFAALWGGLFDWLAAERRDARAAVPEVAMLRAGEPVRWRRGGADSVVRVVLRRRGAGDSTAFDVRFGAGAAVAASPPLAPGVYDARLPGGAAVLAVNAARELLPRRPAIETGPVGGAPAPTGIAPALRAQWWAYVLLVLLFCAEWLLRRRAGLR
jgi:hypothetical protein